MTRFLCLLLTMLLMPSVHAAEDTGTLPPLVSVDGPPSSVYAQRREIEGFSLVMHAPQIRSWPEFERIEALMAAELAPPDGSASS